MKKHRYQKLSNNYKGKYWTQEQVAEHCLEGDLWIISGGYVYDLSEFKHPGGLAPLLKHAGGDASREIVKVRTHRQQINRMIETMKQYRIGKVSD